MFFNHQKKWDERRIRWRMKQMNRLAFSNKELYLELFGNQPEWHLAIFIWKVQNNIK